MMAEGPFHSFERQVQQMFNVADEALDLGLAMVTNAINPMTIPFLQSLPFVVVSYLDLTSPIMERTTDQSEVARYPSWTTLLHGTAGFFTIAPTGTGVCVQQAVISAEDVLVKVAQASDIIPMAIMVIDFEKRKRYRINGYAEHFQIQNLKRDDTSVLVKKISFDMKVMEAFGNCPKYIQSRRIVPLISPTVAVTPNPTRTQSQLPNTRITFTPDHIHLIQHCDTAFLTTYHAPSAYSLPSDIKVDITHRGGNPGFIRIMNENTLIWPEYQGNNMYMTLGNIYGNRKVGLLLIDFEKNIFLKLSGDAVLLQQLPVEAEPMDSSSKYVQFTVTEPIYYVDSRLPFKFQLLEVSPYNPRLKGFRGNSGTADVISTRKKVSNEVHTPEVILKEVIPWSENIASFQFSFPKQNLQYLPAQYVMIRFIISSLSVDTVRTWTITSIPASSKKPQRSDDVLQITVKKIGKITSWLFDQFNGLSKEAVEKKWNHLLSSKELSCEFVGTGGDFTPFRFNKIGGGYSLINNDYSSLLFFSGGIGATPFLGMIKGLYSNERLGNEEVLIRWFLTVRNVEGLNFLFDLPSYLNSAKRVSIAIIVSVTDPATSTSSYDTETLNQYYELSREEKGIAIQSLSYGRIDQSLIQRYCEDIPHAEVFACGPSGFMKAVKASLPPALTSHFHTEDFYY